MQLRTVAIYIINDSLSAFLERVIHNYMLTGVIVLTI